MMEGNPDPPAVHKRGRGRPSQVVDALNNHMEYIAKISRTHTYRQVKQLMEEKYGIIAS